MSHVVGTVQSVAPVVVIGPDSGSASSSPGTWTVNFQHTPAPTGTKFVILHFKNANLPANNRLEVDLGYDTDVFTSVDGNDFWTRPVNLFALAGALIPIRYITSGALNGGVTLDKYGRGERHAGEQDPSALSNCDPFLGDASYVEPIYDPFWFCHTPPNWENIECVPIADFRLPLSRSVGMVLMVDTLEGNTSVPIVSSCSVTLIDANTVLTAGHCFEPTGNVARTASVIFNYETACGGSRPGAYSGRFVKVQKQIAWRYDAGFDYCLHQLKTLPGLPPIPVRKDIPAVGEKIFGIHHPNGAIKKLSIPHPGFETVLSSSASGIRVDLDVSGGSSGSGLFDTTGRITGVLSNGNACSLTYFPTSSIFKDIAAPPAAPAITRDVMIVFDRSGSMSLPAGTGRSKMQEAHDAASLFVQLVQSGTGNRVGLVSFSTQASTPVDFAIAGVTGANKTALVGPAPFEGGIVGALVADGTTTIGGGLIAASQQFPAPVANPRTILLLTDGLQNTWPMISDAQSALGGIGIEVIGFGTEANLDGAILTALAETHGGLYHRAGDPLALRKFFALAFGNIFESGTLLDPVYQLPANQPASAPIPFSVCGEERLTIIAGWDAAVTQLSLRVTSPAGAIIEATSAGIESSSGRGWTFLRISLPHGGERDGAWSAEVVRSIGRGEFASAPAATFFVNVVVNGGPRLTRFAPAKQYYTGDTINPLVIMRYANGGFPDGAKVQLTVTRPNASVGSILSQAKLGAAATVAADTVPARQATLISLEHNSGKPVVGYIDQVFELFDDAKHNHGSFEESGIFGNPLDGLLTVEGNYTFHARATYGTGCVSSRELIWSLHVAVKVDPSRTTTTTSITGTNPDGSTRGNLVVTPRDSYGNNLGPGLSGGFDINGGASTNVTGPVRDNGDGSYTIPVSWNPSSGPPSIVVTQPGTPPAIVGGPLSPDGASGGGNAMAWWWLLLIALIVLFLLLVLINK